MIPVGSMIEYIGTGDALRAKAPRGVTTGIPYKNSPDHDWWLVPVVLWNDISRLSPAGEYDIPQEDLRMISMA
jgi:hypothetical protein